jgi:hypothetical protein
MIAQVTTTPAVIGIGPKLKSAMLLSGEVMVRPLELYG